MTPVRQISLLHHLSLPLTPLTASIKAAAAVAANGLMKLYVNNATGTTPIKVGTFDKPIYWWEAGAVWGGLVDYWSYTGDASFAFSTNQALLAQKGPANDFMNVEWEKELVRNSRISIPQFLKMKTRNKLYPKNQIPNSN